MILKTFKPSSILSVDISITHDMRPVGVGRREEAQKLVHGETPATLRINGPAPADSLQ